MTGTAVFALMGVALVAVGEHTFGLGMLAIAPWLPVLVVQDYWRWVGFMSQRPGRALANDTVFNCVQGAAFTLVLRRLENPGIASAGLSVLMRYTLRLLTLDQLSRAATLICALELERQRDVEKLGEWPFEIGLWVGKAATPSSNSLFASAYLLMRTNAIAFIRRTKSLLRPSSMARW